MSALVTVLYTSYTIYIKLIYILHIIYTPATYAAQGTIIDDTKQHTKQASLEAIYTNVKDQCQDLLIGMRRLSLDQVTALVTTSTTTSVLPIKVAEGQNYDPSSDIMTTPPPPTALPLPPLLVQQSDQEANDTEGEGGGFQLSLEGIEGMVEVTESDMLDVSAMLLDDDDDQAPPLPLLTSTSSQLHLQQVRQDQQQQVIEESAALRRVGIHVLHSAAKRAAMSKQNAAHVFPGYSTEHPCATHPSHIQALQAAHATPGFANPLQLIAKIAVTKTSPFASTTAPSPQMYSNNNNNNNNNMNASSSPYALPYATSSTGILDPGIASLPPPLSSLRPNLSMNSMGGAAEDPMLTYPHHQQQQFQQQQQQAMYHTAPPPQSMIGSNITQRLQQQHQQQPNISLPGVPTMSHTQPMLYSGYPTNTGQGLKQSPTLPQHTVGTVYGTGQPGTGSMKGAAPPLYNMPQQQQQGKSMQWDGSNNNNTNNNNNNSMLLQRTQQVSIAYFYSS